MGASDVDLIRREIAAVRGEMDETLGAIADRLDVARSARARLGRAAGALRGAAAEMRVAGPGPVGRPADLADRARRGESVLRGHPLAWALLIWSGAIVVLLLIRLLRS